MEKIIVLDFGSQYNQLIVRKVRKLGVYSELLPYDTDLSKIDNIKGIILSGGPKSVYDNDYYIYNKSLFNLNVPILGICYGMQLLVKDFGGFVKSSKREYGKQEIKILNNSLLTKDLPLNQVVWMSHGDEIEKLPNDFEVLAKSSSNVISIIKHKNKDIYGTQFHPEVEHTVYGLNLISNFLFNICKMTPNWNMDNFIDDEIKKIKDLVGNDKVIMAISGGVDSSVAAVIINKAIKDNLTCLFIDHGLLRKDEARMVMDTFKNLYNINVIKIDAKERFLNKLKGVTDPEKKRKIIGNEFIYIFQEEAIKLGGDYKFLGQGTLYTDVIESGTKTAKVIKSHHNVGGLPKDLNFKLIEPLNKLFKDEVRELGLKLGIHKDLIYRQPFPGPGLAIRIIGEVTTEKLNILREADFILRDEIKKANLDKEIWQYFCVLPNVLSVGVQGDNRSYEHLIAIRCISSIDGMTATFSRIDYDILDKISRRIVNEIKEVNRVVYDITSKPPATIEWE